MLARLLAAAACAAVLHGIAADRPRICLVLSGGGARGAAHIGVLKILEEYRVPIDCIAGTSMGALVGGAYATGTTIPEMEAIVQQVSTQSLFKDRPPRQELSMRRKQDDNMNLASPELGVRDGKFFLQKGAVSGVQLETVLRQLSKARGYWRFDDLPIPLRVVATDLVTGKQVVFGEGELAAVMRASMSVPAAVAPAEIGDLLLVDGGISNNLPVAIAREMGADVVIAVNLGTPLLKRKELDSVVGVASQMLFILTEQNVQASIASLKPGDVLIEPELGDYSFTDFDHLPVTLPIGEAAARKVSGFLQRLSLPAAEYAELRRRQVAAPPRDLRLVDEIRFEGLQRVDPATPATLMSTRAGEPVDPAVLDRDILRLYGTGDFEHVGYRFVDEAGRRILAVEAVEKSWGPDYLRLGLSLTADFQGDAFFNILASYRKTWLNSLGAEWRNDFQLGRVNSLVSEFYQPLIPGGYLFIAPRAELLQQPLDLFQDNRRLVRYNIHYARAGLDAGTLLTRFGEARLGLYAGSASSTVSTGPEDIAGAAGHVTQGGFIARIAFDQLDSANFPRSGFGGGAEVVGSRAGLGATDSYTRWETNWLAAQSFGEHTFLGGIRLGGTIGDSRLPAYDLFQSGGFLLQSGYRTGSLIGNRVEFGRLMYYQRLVRQTLLEGMYAGLSVEAGRIRGSPVPGTPRDWIKSGSVFFGLDTLVGPMYLGYGQSTGGIHSFYFSLGRP